MADPSPTAPEDLDPDLLAALAEDEACGVMEGLAEDVYTAEDPDELADGEGFRLVESLIDPATEGLALAGGGVRALWLPQTLQDAGLRVAVEPGYEGRGRPMVSLEGVMAHHTASSRNGGNAPARGIVRDGRPDLGGPLSQTVLARDGLWIVIASGRANHGGRGDWDGITDLNGRYLAVEAENDGRGEPWPEVQMDSYARGVAAILRRIGKGAHRVPGHKEAAKPRGRKPDPSFDMNAFRARVDGLLRGTVVRPPDPHIPPNPPTGPERLATDGRLGAATFAALQRALGRAGCRIPVDGTCGPATTRCLQAALNHLSHYAGRGDISIDGKMGPQTTKALQWRLGEAQDGNWGPGTTRALQARLNAGTLF